MRFFLIFFILVLHFSCHQKPFKPMPNINVNDSANDFNINRVERVFGKDISTGKTLYCIEGSLPVPTTFPGANRAVAVPIPDLDLVRLVTAVNLNSNPTSGRMVFFGFFLSNIIGGKQVSLVFRNFSTVTSTVTNHNFRILYTKTV